MNTIREAASSSITDCASFGGGVNLKHNTFFKTGDCREGLIGKSCATGAAGVGDSLSVVRNNVTSFDSAFQSGSCVAKVPFQIFFAERRRSYCTHAASCIICLTNKKFEVVACADCDVLLSEYLIRKRDCADANRLIILPFLNFPLFASTIVLVVVSVIG